MQFVKDSRNYGENAAKVFDVFTPEQVLQVITLCSSNELVFRALIGFINKYKTSAKFTLEDLKELEQLLQVKNVMES